MKNSEMIAGRFLRWAKYRKLEKAIRAELAKGNTVIASTYTRHTKLTTANNGEMKATRNGLWIGHGKSRCDYSLCKFTVQAA